MKISWYQLECNERGLVCNEACPNLSQLLKVWYFMWALKHAEQVSWIGITVFWNRKEGLWLYHIFKLLILLFGFIMMFAGVSILQENLNYSPALCVVCEILPQILPQLQKLQVHFKQGHRSVFDMGDDFVSCTGGVWGGCAPSEAGKFCIFETGIVEFAIWWILLGANLEQVMMSKKGGGEKQQFCGPESRDAKGRKVSGNFGNFPWKVSGILKGWEFSEILGIFNFDLFSTFYEAVRTKIN